MPLLADLCSFAFAIDISFKVDSTGFQGNFVDSPSPNAAWSNSRPPLSSTPQNIGLASHAHYYSPQTQRVPGIPSRDIHFQTPHMRQYRPQSSSANHLTNMPEYRISDMNKRLFMRTEESDHQWWESFANEFFEDDAVITIIISFAEGQRRFNINRTLIPRFFVTLYEGGISEIYFLLRPCQTVVHHPTITLDCEQGSMITHFGKPSFIKLCLDGHFNIVFNMDEPMRIKTWQFNLQKHQELIPRSVVAIPTDNPTYLDQLSKNFTRYGLTATTLNFLRLCEILEPMQELMSRNKSTGFSPRDCLKGILNQRLSRQSTDSRAAAPKTRRKRKSNSNNSAANTPQPYIGKDSTVTTPTTPTKKRSSTTSISSQNSTPTAPGANLPGDVMIVGEPSLMGDDMDDEDERFITRIENNQFSSHNSPQFSSSNYQPIPSSPSVISQKQNFPISSTTLTTNSIKREQTSFPESPKQLLPSIFSTNSTNSNMVVNSSNMENSFCETKFFSSSNNSPPNGVLNSQIQTNSMWNNNSINVGTPNGTTVITETKQENPTPPVTPQQTVLTAS